LRDESDDYRLFLNFLVPVSLDAAAAQSRVLAAASIGPTIVAASVNHVADPHWGRLGAVQLFYQGCSSKRVIRKLSLITHQCAALFECRLQAGSTIMAPAF
jgi:hypothetical protein